jgi:tRNA A-37 threonylcarbamoyl transferase component Bud32
MGWQNNLPDLPNDPAGVQIVPPRIRLYNDSMHPENIGRYEILDKIGAGGMAVVYLGQEKVFERQVAIKVLPTHLGQDLDNRERFRREAKAIASLEHAAVVPVYDYGEDGDQLYLVMRYMQGGSLKDRLSHGPVPPAEASRIIGRIAAALDKAHSMGMIHRDIKPGNILFDLEENPYITDFGLVKMVESSVQLTHSEFFGTPAYTSPEQCRGDKTIDGRADVYSLTAMFFHMLTGSPPYESTNAMALLMKHVSEPVPKLADVLPGLPAGLQAVIDRGMAKDAADRYATTGEMARAIERILSGAPPAVKAEPAAVWGAPAVSAAPPSATESAPAVSFNSLRAAKQPAAAPGEAMATRRDSFAPGKMPAAPPIAGADFADSEATNALDLRAIPTERRRLEWTPQADTAPNSVLPAAPPAGIQTTQPAASYTQPPKPLEKKTSGIPVLILVVVLLVISLIYFAVQKGLF